MKIYNYNDGWYEPWWWWKIITVGCGDNNNCLWICETWFPPNYPINQQTAWSRILPEKLRVTQVVKKFPAFYGTRWFITVFTSARTISMSENGTFNLRMLLSSVLTETRISLCLTNQTAISWLTKCNPQFQTLGGEFKWSFYLWFRAVTFMNNMININEKLVPQQYV